MFWSNVRFLVNSNFSQNCSFFRDDPHVEIQFSRVSRHFFHLKQFFSRFWLSKKVDYKVSEISENYFCKKKIFSKIFLKIEIYFFSKKNMSKKSGKNSDPKIFGTFFENIFFRKIFVAKFFSTIY